MFLSVKLSTASTMPVSYTSAAGSVGEADTIPIILALVTLRHNYIIDKMSAWNHVIVTCCLTGWLGELWSGGGTKCPKRDGWERVCVCARERRERERERMSE